MLGAMLKVHKTAIKELARAVVSSETWGFLLTVAVRT